MIPIYRWNQTPDSQKAKILARSGQDIDAFIPKAQDIIDRVKAEGDKAIVALTKEFDGADLSQCGLRVTQEEIKAAGARLDPKVKK
ncbi:histidinol dehydrogenase, partial [bacterium]|nr:histidinol dehydrogenase [bacterium]